MFLNKYLILKFVLLILSCQSFAITDWDDLNRLAPQANMLSVKSSDGSVQAKLIRFSGQVVRIKELTSVYSKSRPQIVVDGPEQNIQQLCEKSIRFGRRFGAKLILSLSPFFRQPQDFKVYSENGDEFDLFRLSNNLNIGKPQILVSNSALKWSLIDTPIGQGSIQEIYQKFLNDKIGMAAINLVEIDLSDKNGLACDLMEGYLSFTLKQEVQHETGFPDSVDWIGKDNFVATFQSFWDLNTYYKNEQLTKEQQQQMDLMSLGLAAAGKVEADKLLKNSTRGQKLLFALQMTTELSDSVKKQIKYEEVLQNHKMTFEYIKPLSLTVKKSFITTGTPVSINFIKKGL